MFKRPSQKLEDIFREMNEAPPDPIERHKLPFEQRQVLSAYGRARSVRCLGREVSVKDICEYAQDELPYGSVPRSKVAGILQELMDLGFNFIISDYSAPRASTRKNKPIVTGSAPEAPEPGESVTVSEKPAAKVSADPKPERKPRAKTTRVIPHLRSSADNPRVLELVGDVEPKTALVSAATAKGAYARSKRRKSD